MNAHAGAEKVGTVVASHSMIVGIWLLSIAHGILFIISTPLWEGFDEPFHYAYIQNLAEHGQIPVYGKTLISEEITASFRVLPLSPAVNSNLSNRYTVFADYFRLPREIQKERERALKNIPRTARRIPDESQEACLNYEAQHPPLYYLLSAVIYRMSADKDLPTLIFVLRAFSLLIGSLTIILSYKAAKFFYSKPSKVLSIPLLIALLPMFFSTVARISNDSLGVTLFSLLVLLVLKYIYSGYARKNAVYIGIVTGLGLLTKAYFLTAIPVIIGIIIAAGIKQRTMRPAIGRLLWTLFPMLVIAGWWYARNYVGYGTISGLFVMASAVPIPLKDQIKHIVEIPWFATLNLIFREQLWTGNSSFISLSKMIYRTGYLLAGMAFLGLIRIYIPILSKSMRMPKPDSHPSGAGMLQLNQLPANKDALSVMISFYAFFVLGMMYQVHQTFVITGQITTGGWYLYAMVIPTVLLLSNGLEALLWPGAKKLVPAILVVYALIVNLLGNFCKAIPYYAGFAIPHFHVRHLFEVYSAGGFKQIVEQLSMNKPVFMNPTVTGVCIGVYLALLILILGFWFRMQRSMWREIGPRSN